LQYETQYDKVIRNERETVKAPTRKHYWSDRNMGDPLVIWQYIDQRLEDLKVDPDRGGRGELLALKALIEAAMEQMADDLQKGRP
jgi:hypothetical protein